MKLSYKYRPGGKGWARCRIDSRLREARPPRFERLESRLLLDAAILNGTELTQITTAEVDRTKGQTVADPLEGDWVTNDVILQTPTQWLTSELLVLLSRGTIFQEHFAGVDFTNAPPISWCSRFSPNSSMTPTST